MTRIPAAVLSASLVLSFAWGVRAQTPDGETPAEEKACDKYEGEGARHGLCVAYCEAQDCREKKLGDDPSCDRIVDRFIEWSVKNGYVKGKPKPGSRTIDCSVTACSKDDVALCRGRELDCDIDGDAICEEICSSEFVGFLEDGTPVCTKPIECSRKCVKDEKLP